MSEDFDKNLMEDHNYDGIQELDNDLPFWWISLFILTIISGAVYFAYYTFNFGPDQEEEYRVSVERAEAKEQAIQREQAQKERLAALAASKKSGKAAPVVEEVLTMSEKTIANGKVLFAKHCFTCHGPLGQGLVGPNMTDNFFIHGPKLEDAIKIISNGVPAKGMLAWKTMLKKKEIFDLATFIFSLKGKNLPGKPPEGKEYK